MELYELTALELAGQLRAGAVTQAEAIAAAAGQIAACQPGNNAFIHAQVLLYLDLTGTQGLKP